MPLLPLRPHQQVAIDGEHWLSVVGYEGAYEVSDLGRVRSVDRIIVQKTRWGGLSSRAMKGFVLAPCDNGRGYVTVQLGSKGSKASSKRFYIHILVLAAFVGPMPEGEETAHGDNNRGNNRLDNIRYAKPIDNAADKKVHGTYLVGEQGPAAKLNAEQVVQIRSFPPEFSSVEIGDMFGISDGHICRIRSRQSWAHLP